MIPWITNERAGERINDLRKEGRNKLGNYLTNKARTKERRSKAGRDEEREEARKE